MELASTETLSAHESFQRYRPAQYHDPAISEDAAGTDVVTEVRREAALLKTGALQNAISNSENLSSTATDEKGVIQLFNVATSGECVWGSFSTGFQILSKRRLMTMRRRSISCNPRTHAGK